MRRFRYGPEVRAEVVRRLAAGERLKDIAREAGMPCPESVTGWMRADPGFAAEVARARAAAAGPRVGFDAETARRLLARLGGEAIGRILRDPDMPGPGVFYRGWLRGGQAPGWFHEAYAAAMAGRASAAARRGTRRGRWRAFDREVAERIYVRLWKGETLRAILRSDPAFPSLSVLARWRREDADFGGQMRLVTTGMRRRHGARRTLCTPKLTEAIVVHICMGHSLRSLSRLPGMPSTRAMTNWIRTRPAFAEAVREAAVRRRDDLEDQMLVMRIEARPSSERAARRLTAALSRQETRLRRKLGPRSGGG